MQGADLRLQINHQRPRGCHIGRGSRGDRRFRHQIGHREFPGDFGDSFREIVEPEFDDPGVPIGVNRSEPLQVGLHLNVPVQRLPDLAGIIQRIRLLHQAVKDDILVIRVPALGACRRQERGQHQEQGSQIFHADMLIQPPAAWQRLPQILHAWRLFSKKIACH